MKNLPMIMSSLCLTMTGCASPQHEQVTPEASAPAPEATSERYYEVVLIWLKDPQTFAKYGQALGPLAAKYGAGLERQLAPKTIYGHKTQTAAPAMVNVVYYRDQEAYDQFMQDPEFLKLRPLREASIDMVSVGGGVIGGQGPGAVDEAALAKRLYVIEIAKYGPGGATAYEAYEEVTNPVLEKYGFHLERSLTPKQVHALGFDADVIKVGYYDAQDALERMESDPMHDRIEKQLYPAAVSESVWVMGSAMIH